MYNHLITLPDHIKAGLVTPITNKTTDFNLFLSLNE